MMTIGCSRLSIVPAHVAYWPPRPMLMLPVRCAGSEVARVAHVEDLRAVGLIAST